MAFPPAFTHESLEDFSRADAERHEAANEKFYTDAAEERLREIRAAIDAAVTACAPMLRELARHDALDFPAMNRGERRAIKDADRIAWARAFIREQLTEMLPVADIQAIADLT